MISTLPLAAIDSVASASQQISVGFPWWAWLVFSVVTLGMLALDLGVFHKKEHVVSFKEAISWTVVWIALAGLFGMLIWFLHGPEEAGIFATGYILEKALSVDNLFVILLIFGFFKIPDELRHRVLFWGILGAALMRAVFILAGVALVQQFSWLMYVFGAVLLFTGIKMALPEKEEEHDLSKNIVVRTAKKIFPMSDKLHGKNFFIRENGILKMTPLFLALLVVEATDVVFAVDSIPAIIGILPNKLSDGTVLNQSSKNFLAFTSNIFAILGLRSMFFALSGFMKYFRFLKIGLAFILVFIAVKMIGAAAKWFHIDPYLSIGILGGVLLVATIASIVFPEKKTH